ncbi:MAG: GntR family transcriptional regulator [Actinobacteria bacterium]|nr:GntR family transcriptional regulator [Actinomycetota bacterium]
MNEVASVNPVKPDEPLTQRAYVEIRSAILEGRLAAGSMTSVRTLSEALGISRTPVREALVELANDQLVAFERNRGVRILETQAHDVEEIFELRLLIEVPSVASAIARSGPDLVAELRASLEEMRAHLDDEPSFMHHDWLFHRALLAATGNERLVSFVESLRNQTRMRGLSTAGRSRPLAAIVEEHVVILRAVEAADADAAVAAMSQHLTNTRDLLLAQEQPPSDTSNTQEA